MGKGGARRIDPRDRAQLAESPVRLGRVLRLFRPHWWRIALIVVVIAETSLVALGQPLLIKVMVDRAIPQVNRPLLLLCFVGLILVAAANGILGIVQAWQTTSAGQAVMNDLRTSVFDHLQRMSMVFFTRTRGSEIQSRLTHDIGGLQSIVTNTATSIIASVTTVTATTVAMLALSPPLTLLTAIVLPPAILVTRRIARMRRTITLERQRTLVDMTGQIEEALSVNGALLTKLLGIAPLLGRQFAATSGLLAAVEIRSRMAGRGRLAAMDFVFAAIPALVFLAAGYPAWVGELSLGTIIAFTTLQAAIFRPLMNLLNLGADWIASMALLSRIFGYLDLPVEVPEPTHPVALDPRTLRGEVRFEHVSYRYPGTDSDVLRAVSLHLPAGSSVAVVGETGSGKTTLGSLLARLADPTGGRITIDGIDLRDTSTAERSAVIGVVNQSPYLIHASIADNLLLAKADASVEDLWEALEAAQIATLVRALPEGLDTIVGAHGQRLSGGERQRLSIARTLLRNPRILVLDEATSALDTRTESSVQEALSALAHGRTTLTIAHRISTIREADRICVLADGAIVEEGTFDQLWMAGGRFTELAAKADAAHRWGPVR